jgi:hypothetical protein
MWPAHYGFHIYAWELEEVLKLLGCPHLVDHTILHSFSRWIWQVKASKLEVKHDILMYTRSFKCYNIILQTIFHSLFSPLQIAHLPYFKMLQIYTTLTSKLFNETSTYTIEWNCTQSSPFVALGLSGVMLECQCKIQLASIQYASFHCWILSSILSWLQLYLPHSKQF